MSESSQRRRHLRVLTSMPVRISTIESEKDPWTGRPFFRATKETCSNLSRGGAFVRTEEPLDPGRRVLVEIDLPGGRQLEAIGRVAWSKRVLGPPGRAPGSGVGIEFLGGAADQFAALEDFIEDQNDPASPSS